MPASVLSGLRLVATLPPVEHFWGANAAITRVQLSALRELGATVYEFDTSPFYRSDHNALQSQVSAVKDFQPDAVIALPTAGYAAEVMVEDGAIARNLFLDILELPTIFCWDHALVHAPRYVLQFWPPEPLYSTPDVKQALRSLLMHPLSFHFFCDTGYISEFRRLGIASFDQVNYAPSGYLSQAAIDCGRNGGGEHCDNHTVSFFGNLYIEAARHIQYQDGELTAIREAALNAVMSDWDYPAYYAYLREIDALDPKLRSKLGLDPDQSFYWRYLYDELCVVANGEPRFRKLLACGHPVTYFGGFADPESRVLALNAGWQLAEYLPFGSDRLAAAYRQSRVSIDVTNAPFINGFGSKLLECFAAGGFMLTTRKADMSAVLGSLADAIGFSNAEELAAKVDLYLTDDRQRLEVAREIRELVRRDWSAATMFARIVPLALERLRARVAAGARSSKRSEGTVLHPRKLGPALFDVRLDSLKFVEGASGQVVEQGLVIVTSPQQWAYSLYSPSLGEQGFTGEAVVRIQVEVRRGRLGLAIATRESLGKFIVEFPSNPSMHLRIIDIPVRDLASTGVVVVRNQSDGPSEATIRSIQVFRPEGFESSSSRDHFVSWLHRRVHLLGRLFVCAGRFLLIKNSPQKGNR